MFRWAFSRWMILGGALLATVVASVWPRGQDEPMIEVVPPVAKRDAAPLRDKKVAELPPLGALRERQRAGTDVQDLFGAKTWSAPPAPQQPRPAPAPVAPVAPPFPYTVAGSVLDPNGLMIVFTHQQRNFVLRVGEVLEQTYRVESIDPQSVTLTFLPLGLTQRVPIGASN
jgi:hypothetical protein